MKRILFVFITLSSMQLLHAQEKEKDSKISKNSYFKAALNYLSNAVYSGRKDSLVMPYFSPSLGYYDKSGFSISGSVSYLSSSSESRIDLFSLDLGYDFSISDKLSAGIYGNKSFYNKSSSVVGSEIKGSMGGYFTYDPGILSIGGGIDAAFSQSTDIGINGSLSHVFSIGEEGDQWSISPIVTVNAGSQNYYQDYYKNRKKSLKINRTGNVNTIIVKNANQFILLDYEIGIPLTYDAKKWGLYVKPTYAIPQNPVSFSINNGLTYTSEKLENSFYAEIGVYIKF